MKSSSQKLELVILSGLSGSGKSTALHALEDAGYFAIDNLPSPLLPQLLELLKPPSQLSHLRKMAIVMDAREMGFVKDWKAYLQFLKLEKIPYQIIFLDSRDEVILRRFSETRRRHPLSPASRVSTGIAKERKVLHPFRAAATHRIDTSYMNVHELRDAVLSVISKRNLKNELSITLVSFGYRYGIPLEADLLFDVRFLKNPHFVPHLKAFSGENPKVSAFVLKQGQTQKFLKLLKSMLALLLKAYLHEGKTYLVIGFGCTGGRHRSVAVARKVAELLKEMNYPVKIQHRDISR